MTTTYIFHDLDPIQKRLVHLADDLGYVVLAEVTGRSQTDKLARVNLNETDLAPFLVARTGEDAGEEGERDHDGDEDRDRDEDDGVQDHFGGAYRDATPADIARAAVRWVQETAGAQMNSTRRRKFKVSAWSPKGDRLIYSARFSCENPDWDAAEEDDDLEERRRPPVLVPGSHGLTVLRNPAASPTPGTPPANDKPSAAMVMLEAIPEGRVWKALGGGYEHLLTLYERGFGGLSDLQNDALSMMGGQNRRNQVIIESLADRLITLKVGTELAENEGREDEASSRVNQELGKQFISELGGLGRVFATAKFGMAPEMVELADIVTASPELMDAMRRPEVLKMLRDEKTRKELASLLVAASSVPPSTDPPSTPNPPTDLPQAA